MSLPAKVCMNGLCGATMTAQWKRGWPMKVGGFANLCYTCGTEYDNVRYCERFHLNEPGWRECKYCEKPIHCGCVVSKYLHECLDSGGISCIKCIRAKGVQPLKQSIVSEIPNGFTRFSGNWLPSVFTNQTNNVTPLTEGQEKNQFTSSPSSKEFSTHCSSSKDDGSSFKNPLPFSTIFSNQLPLSITPNNHKPNLGSCKSIYDQPPQQSLGFSAIPTSNGVAEERIQEKVPSFKQVQKPRQIVPKSLKSGVSIRSHSNKGSGLSSGSGSENRVGRPPGEGRGRSQLLPRYWPKITDQELMQISGDLNSNCTITPLFEKVLSASDAGGIGRFVLPKACAEAYFPPINQSEGVPIKIRDIKGIEWTFQFRFWPNNNSRMYVLEGVTPCIQNMQLQAGDIVIFSRLDPEDKLIIGFRKATIFTGASALPNPTNGGALTFTGNGNSPSNMEHEGTSKCDSVQALVNEEKKKARNIGPKSKRLHMHSEDALELRFTWEEAQEYLRPPLSKPTLVMIDNCELEEYDEPPVFGKETIFTMNASRCSCSAPEEKGVQDLRRILRFGKESKKRKVTENRVTEQQQTESTGLDATITRSISSTEVLPSYVEGEQPSVRFTLASLGVLGSLQSGSPFQKGDTIERQTPVQGHTQSALSQPSLTQPTTTFAPSCSTYTAQATPVIDLNQSFTQASLSDPNEPSVLHHTIGKRSISLPFSIPTHSLLAAETSTSFSTSFIPSTSTSLTSPPKEITQIITLLQTLTTKFETFQSQLTTTLANLIAGVEDIKSQVTNLRESQPKPSSPELTKTI